MIEFDHVSKIYNGNKVAVEDINLSFDKGEFICLIGTSGSGKTTTMRMIDLDGKSEKKPETIA